MRWPWHNRSEATVIAPINKTSETRRFECGAQSIVFDSLFADITVEVVDDENPRVEMEGLPSQLNRITVTETSCGISIKGSLPRGYQLVRLTIDKPRQPLRRTIVQLGLRTGFHIIYDDTSPSVRLFVPRGTDLALREVDGTVVIGHTEGNLSIKSSSSYNAAIGRVADLNVYHDGSGDMTIAAACGDVVIKNSYAGNITLQRVDGNLSIENDGSGDVRVVDGQVLDAHLTLSYAGDVSYLGGAVKATLKSDGSGKLIVGSVSQELEVELEYAGGVTINEGHTERAKLASDGSGDITHGGTVGLARITIDYAGDVSVGKVTNRYQRGGDGSGELIIRDEEPMPSW